MGQQVTFEGKSYTFPDDASPEEIADALDGVSQAPSGMTSIPIPYDMAAPGATNIDYDTLGPGLSGLRAAGRGAMLGFGDEIMGAAKGYLPALFSGKDPEKEYARIRDAARRQDDREAAKNPNATLAGNIAGQVATGAGAALATGGQSLLAMLGLGAAQGTATGIGESEATDAGGMALDGLKGGAWGTGGALVGYAGGKIIEKLVNKGIAFAAIQKAVDGNTDDLVREMSAKGISAAEADTALKELLTGMAARNPTEAVKAIPGAQARIAQAGAQTVDDVNRLVSPDNAAQFIQQLQQQGQKVGSAGYGAAYANPTTVALVPSVANNPAAAPAIEAAKKLAAAEGRPFDVNAMTVQDLDAMQRALKTYASKMFDSTPENTLLGPVYSKLGDDINKMASQMAPAGPGNLAAVQGEYAVIKATQDAVELGQKALNPSKEFVEVADEFANLSPEAQKGYLAGMATKLRTMLQQKSSTANPGAAFNKESVIEKLKAVGFPDDQIDAIIKRGGSARGVLDALVGGSDTAKKLGAMDASKSAVSKFADRAGQDLSTAALLKSPVSLLALPAAKAVGGAQDRAVAARLIQALTDQSGVKLQGLLGLAPQNTTTPILNLLGLGAGGSAAGQFGGR